jgi:STE24 endopeptidase
MNMIGVVILTALLLDLALNAVADYLNLKTLGHDLPEEFRDVYDKERYLRSQEYLQVNTRFGWVIAAVNFLLLLIFWFGNGFQLIDGWVRSWGLSPVPTGVAYIGFLSLLVAAIGVPFNAYSTFVIEERFGFNQTTWSTFFIDKLKGLGISLVLGVPLLAGVLAFFEFAGSVAWFYCWGVVTLYMLVVQFIAPAWIMPLFNRFNILEDGELKEAIFTYARSIDFSLDNIFIMDGSRRSSKSNAFFTGFGRYKRIVLFDTMIEKHSTAELVAVLAHEMGHFKRKHILKSLLIAIGQSGLMFYMLSIVISYPGLFKAFFMDTPSVYTGLVFFALLYSPFDVITGLFLRKLSRKNEYEADRFAAATTRDPQAMVTALKKLSVHNLSNLRPHPFYVFLNYTHPPVLARIRAIAQVGIQPLEPVLET